MAKFSMRFLIRTAINMKKTLLISLTFLLCGVLMASPTSYDYEKCNKLAVAHLKQCLAGNEGDCWKQSKLSYQACRNHVAKSYTDIKIKREIAQEKLKSQLH
mgnify:CR=1 FL=1